ncbi:MAG: hydrolase [Candidatus Buchananbacteria bacterium RBG_13_39_9]|uniref:Hydrolase n=1 Tax=Candidatus Buchananbacteria bacterium RBG_13_39_9 TaxID=1797531 RepID=A0A1G1XQV5_9BACT|nr:MAG: hydrolase [Candidatus Buchananbacteria bacterium RBG_13_39_9]
MAPNKQALEVKITIDSLVLPGNLTLVDQSQALVIFAHGSGSSRLSPRNQYVADVLHQSGISTLLFDLLTEKEDRKYENRFNIPLLAERLVAATQWAKQQKELANCQLGYFGASTGAAAALIAAAELGDQIKAVVSRGGRPDLALDILDKVFSPVLLIVGGDDDQVIVLNQKAHEKIKAIKELSIIPGATHLFEEPGKLEEAAKQAAAWFKKYLVINNQ